MDRRCRGSALVLVVLALAVLAVPSAAEAQDRPPAPGAALVEICRASGLVDVPELGSRTCTTLDSGAVLLAVLCRSLGLPADACADLTDGRVVDRSLIDEHERSWAHRALRLQARLDEGEPLRAGLVPHTHNSANATAYAPRLANADPNQRYGIEDQLRMGIRGIELDLHWVPHPTGTAATGHKAVVLCHGRSETVGPATVHLGCSVDRRFEEGLAEIRAFLDRAGNEREVVLLYLENQLDGDPRAHDLAASALESVLGDEVARPPGAEPCAPMPLEASRADLLDAGHRVLIVGNCGPGAWGSWVHERGPGWDERGNSGGYPAFELCTTERAERNYDERFIRVFEDSTWLSAMAGSGSTITPSEVTAMVRCGVNMPGLDRVEPFDDRLDALVWSWARGEPAPDAAGACAAWGTDARFRAEACGEERAFACRLPDGRWTVPDVRGPSGDGPTVCAAAGGRHDVPATGWDNEGLRAAAAGAGELWLDYRSGGEGWAPHAPSWRWPGSIASSSATVMEPAVAPRRAASCADDARSIPAPTTT